MSVVLAQVIYMTLNQFFLTIIMNKNSSNFFMNLGTDIAYKTKLISVKQNNLSLAIRKNIMSCVDYFSNFMHKITSGNHFGIQICHALKMYICQHKFFFVTLKNKITYFY